MHEESQHKIDSCRVCLKPNDRRGLSLFDYYKNVAISVCITSIAEVSITESDDLPQKICLQCFKQLQIAIEFKHKCESSHATLLSTLKVKKEEDSIKEEECLKIEESEEEYFEETQELTAEKVEEVGIDNDHDDTMYDDASNTSFHDDDIEYKHDEITTNTELKLNREPEEYHFDDFKNEKQSHPNNEQKQLVAEPTKPPNRVELGLRESRAIDLKLVCDDCGGLFKSKCKLRVHWKNVHLPQVLTCNLCKARFGSFKFLKAHRSKRKKCEILSKANIMYIRKKKFYQCTMCSYKTTHCSSWMYHYNSHIGARPNVCDICGKSFTQPITLSLHKESKHQVYEREITCQYCGKVVKGRTRIYKHLKRHTAKLVPCDICGKKVKEFSWKQHKMIHYPEKKFECDICDKKYSMAYALVAHKMSHQQHEEVNCDLCKFKAPTLYSLKEHKKKHKLSLNFTCKTCFQIFVKESSLKNHIIKFHTDKKYKCNHCEKGYMREDRLTTHMREAHNLCTNTKKAINSVVKTKIARVNNRADKKKIEKEKKAVRADEKEKK